MSYPRKSVLEEQIVGIGIISDVLCFNSSLKHSRMRRLDTKRIVSKMPMMASKNYKKYSQAGPDIKDVLDTDEDRVMLYYAQKDKNDTNLLKRSRKAYHA